MEDNVIWRTNKYGQRFPITNEYMNNKIRNSKQSEKQKNLMDPKKFNFKNIYRAYNEQPESENSDLTGIYYDDSKDVVLELYGEQLDTKSFMSDAKIYENEFSSWDYIHKNNFADKNYEFLKNIKSRFYPIENDKNLTTFNDIIEDIKNKGYGISGTEYGTERNFTDMAFLASQMIAKYELEKQGYDGVHWRFEEEGDPGQYQIWNKKILSNKVHTKQDVLDYELGKFDKK